jgi:HEAT repeat protein
MTRETRFQQAVDEWKQWAATADRSENGWETDFPQWPALVEVASQAMTDAEASPRELELLSFCWSISDETEELSSAAAEQNDQCLPALEHIAAHGDQRARWQVFAAIELVNERTKKLLETGLSDPDLYCRRRAVLSWARLGLPNQKQIIEANIRHSDPYLRQATLDLAESSGDPAILTEVRMTLLRDPVDHVRRAAEESLGSENR